MLRVLALVPVFALACRTSATGAQPSSGDPSRGREPIARPTEPAAEGPDDGRPPSCVGEGQVWDGRPTGCAYEHAGCCYDDAESACAAADCPRTQCQVLESYPAQIACDPP